MQNPTTLTELTEAMELAEASCACDAGERAESGNGLVPAGGAPLVQ